MTRMTVSGGVKMIATVLAVVAASVTVALAGVNEDLLVAAKRGDLTEVKRLIFAGADVNARDIEGLTALIDASAEGRRQVVELLLAKGAEVNAKSKDGKTALMFATRKNHPEVRELLIKAGAK